MINLSWELNSDVNIFDANGLEDEEMFVNNYYYKSL